MTSFGPCQSWTPVWGVCRELDAASPVVTGNALAAATHVLWALTGRQFGECELTIRPCRRSCYTAPWPGGWTEWTRTSWPQPMLHGGVWYNLTCGGCVGECSCSSLSEAVLPSPVASIVQVKVDGVVLSPTAYRLDNNRSLIRIGASWPACQNLARDDTQVGTWSVTARFGQPVPELAQLAVGEMACEMIKGMSGIDCRLPAQVTSLARQGVTISMPDPTTMFERGLTGLYFADRLILATNPNHLQAPPEVFSVDHPRGHRRVAT